jgi:folylpolyglutamate synthase
MIAQQDDLRRLNVIHVAGTKGKGSTCRLVSSLLKTYHKRRGMPVKNGMLTGPHLLSCTERIQINGTSISEEAFAESFSRVFNTVNQEPPLRLRGHRMAQLVALMAIDYAVSQGVDFFVCEAFCGG